MNSIALSVFKIRGRMVTNPYSSAKLCTNAHSGLPLHFKHNNSADSRWQNVFFKHTPIHLWIDQKLPHWSSLNHQTWTPLLLHNKSLEQVHHREVYTLCSISTHSFNTIIKVVDGTSVIGPGTGGNESFHKDEMQKLAQWCGRNNLQLNTTKTTRWW